MENCVEQKRDVPLTIWITSSELARLEVVIQRLSGQGELAVMRPKRSVVSYMLFRSGLSSFELRQSTNFSPPTDAPEGKIVRRKQPSFARRNRKLKQSA